MGRISSPKDFSKHSWSTTNSGIKKLVLELLEKAIASSLPKKHADWRPWNYKAVTNIDKLVIMLEAYYALKCCLLFNTDYFFGGDFRHNYPITSFIEKIPECELSQVEQNINNLIWSAENNTKWTSTDKRLNLADLKKDMERYENTIKRLRQSKLTNITTEREQELERYKKRLNDFIFNSSIIFKNGSDAQLHKFLDTRPNINFYILSGVSILKIFSLVSELYALIGESTVAVESVSCSRALTKYPEQDTTEIKIIFDKGRVFVIDRDFGLDHWVNDLPINNDSSTLIITNVKLAQVKEELGTSAEDEKLTALNNAVEEVLIKVNPEFAHSFDEFNKNTDNTWRKTKYVSFSFDTEQGSSIKYSSISTYLAKSSAMAITYRDYYSQLNK